MTLKRDHLTKSKTVMVAAFEAGLPALDEARALIDRFHNMIRSRAFGDLAPWTCDAEASQVASFARGIRKDTSAVHGGATGPWSNGQTESHS